MKIIVRQNLEKQANYICFLAKNITRGLYQNNGYYVLPYLDKNNKAVYFPDLNYSKNFWCEINKTKCIDLVNTFPEICIDEVISKLTIDKNIGIDTDYQKIIDKYKVQLKGISKIEILETEFGTAGSYFVKDAKIYLTQRTKNTVYDFEKSLLLALSKYKNDCIAELGSLNWHKRVAIVEFFIGKVKTFVPQKYITDSQNYLKKLGFETKTNLSQINPKKFTAQEENVFNTLTRHKGEVVSFETLANVLWKQRVDEKYSLQAIAKVIENLRKKIRLQGINKELIHTARGKGYFLQN